MVYYCSASFQIVPLIVPFIVPERSIDAIIGATIDDFGAKREYSLVTISNGMTTFSMTTSIIPGIFTMTLVKFSMTQQRISMTLSFVIEFLFLNIRAISLTLRHPAEPHAVYQACPHLVGMWLRP